MVWNSTAPDGTKSVGQNTTILQSNTTYTETTMNLDHYWNIGANEDGRHKWMQTVATNDADTALATNVARAAGIDLVYFSRFVTETESPNNQEAYPFVKNMGESGEGTPYPLGVMQLLGIRAMCIFNVTGNGATITQLFTFNIKEQVGLTEGIIRDSPGKFRAEFSNNLPSENYLVLGGCVNTTENARFIFNMRPSTSVSSAKDTTRIRFYNQDMNDESSTLDPSQCWFVCFGG